MVDLEVDYSLGVDYLKVESSTVVQMAAAEVDYLLVVVAEDCS